MFVCFCLFVCFIDKTRAKKPLGRSHSRILSFTQDGPAVSTKTAQRALQVQLRSAIYTLTSWLGFQDQQSMLTSPETPSPLFLASTMSAMHSNAHTQHGTPQHVVYVVHVCVKKKKVQDTSGDSNHKPVAQKSLLLTI